MCGSKSDVPTTLKAGGVVIREVEWGEMNVALEMFPAGTESAPLLKGLAEDRCHCPHRGYILKEYFRALYKNRVEILSAGEVYQLPLGHTTIFATRRFLMKTPR